MIHNGKFYKTMGILILILGIILLIISIYKNIDYSKKNKTYIQASSIVIDYDEDSDGLLAIIVEYEVDGIKYRKKSHEYSSVSKKLGTEVLIKYNPDNPSDAIFVGDSLNIVLPIFGSIFLIVGILLKKSKK